MMDTLQHPLTIHLSAVVPLAILDLKARGGPDDSDRERAKVFAQTLAEKGDVLLFGGKKGEAAALVSEMTRSLAVLAFVPGGVSLFGEHWEARGRW